MTRHPRGSDHAPSVPVRTFGRLITVAVALLALSSARPARAIVFQSVAAQTAGLGSGVTVLNAEARLVINLSDGSETGCSGSLLDGGQYVLTAAHCVTGETGSLMATSISVDFANVGLSVTSSSYIVDPVWTGSVTNGGDLALIRLNATVNSITGYKLDTASSAVGDLVLIAGYGLTGVGSTGATAGTFGTLYYGANVYNGVYSNIPSVYAYDFDKSGTNADNVFGGGAVGSAEALIASGDSGGASLIEIGNTWEIVGVHDFVACTTSNCTPNSSFGQIAGDTSVYADAAWLDSTLAPEPAAVSIMGIGLLGLLVIRRLPSAACRCAAQNQAPA